jgi:gluconokinase
MMTGRDNMDKRYYIGIDIGTSGVRAAIFDINGNQISIDYREFTMICEEQRMAELDPEIVFNSLIDVVKCSIQKNNINNKSIRAIGISSQMHSLLAVDKNGNYLTNVITWADTRSINEAEFIEKNFDLNELYNKTGCRNQHPMYPLSKILWIKNTMSDIFNKTYKFISIKEYIIYKIFGEYVIDFTDASASGCFNIHQFKWDEDILNNILKISAEKFGEPVECTYTLNNIKSEYAYKMGVKDDTPFTIGSGDGIMANVGCGVFDNTLMSCTIGTSGAMRIAVDKPLLDEKQRTWCYCFTKDIWVSGGAINNGGIILKYFRDQFRNQFEYEAKGLRFTDIYDLFSKYAAEVNPGSDGLIFLPYITGERSPGWNANASGSLFGLRLTHSKKHIIRAGMEGVMYNMFSIYEIIKNIDGNVKQIVANGGYVKSDIWLQIQADIFDKEIVVAGIAEASAFGAAYIAMVAVGDIKNLKDGIPKMRPVKLIKPRKENIKLYSNGYKRFRELYTKFL